MSASPGGALMDAPLCERRQDLKVALWRGPVYGRTVAGWLGEAAGDTVEVAVICQDKWAGRATLLRGESVQDRDGAIQGHPDKGIGGRVAEIGPKQAAIGCGHEEGRGERIRVGFRIAIEAEAKVEADVFPALRGNAGAVESPIYRLNGLDRAYYFVGRDLAQNGDRALTGQQKGGAAVL
jgi:hypothetical protein